MKSITILLLSFAWIIPNAFTKQTAISLKVLERAGVSRNELVRSGIPFAKGALASGQRLGLEDDKNNPLPVQTLETSHWQDGSVRWLLLNFPASLPARGQTAYTLKTAKEAVGDTLALVSLSKDVCRVRTACMAFDINAKGNLISGLSVDGKATEPTNLDFVITDWYFNPLKLSAGSRTIRVEENGPLCSIVKVSGIHAGAWGQKRFDYDLRIWIFENQKEIRFDYTIKDREPEETAPLRSVALEAVFLANGSQFEIGNTDGWREAGTLAKGQSAGVTITGPTEWQPDRNFEAVFFRNDKMIRSVPGRQNGWAALSNGASRITAAVRHDWQQHPKGFIATENKLSVELWPDRTEALVFPRGAEKTHSIHLSFDPRVSGSDFCRRVQKPLMAVATPQQYCGSDAFGLLSPRDTVRFADFEKMTESIFKAYLDIRETNKEWGWMDFGDNTTDPRYWSNNEYDTPHGLMLLFARTGNLDYFDAAEVSAGHMADIDIIHYWPENPEVVGGAHKHDVAHTGHRHRSQMKVHTDHLWTQGMCETYLLTGDRRLLDAAREMGDHLAVEAGIKGVRTDNERNYGWSIIGLIAAYQATDDIVYLKAAEMIWDQVLKLYHPQRALWLNEWGTDPQGKPLLGNKIFMAAVLMDGIANYHRVTGDPRAVDYLLKGCRTIIREGWIEKDKGFYYTPSWEDRFTGRVLDTREQVPLGYTYLLTGDKELLAIGRKQFEASLAEILKTDISESAKSFSIYIRTMPHFQAVLGIVGRK